MLEALEDTARRTGWG